MRNVFWVSALLLVLPASEFPQQGTHIHNGFLKAEEYLDLSVQKQQGYGAGIVDGMLLAPIFGAPENGATLRTIERCVEGMSDTQVKAIIDKFLKDHPERWNDSMHTVVFSTMLQACSSK